MTKPNDEFERMLTKAMRRVEAPPPLLAAVMEAANPEKSLLRPARRVLPFPLLQKWGGDIAASLLLAGLLFGGLQHRRAVERARAERDFARSLEITDRTMAQTRDRLLRAGVVVD